MTTQSHSIELATTTESDKLKLLEFLLSGCTIDPVLCWQLFKHWKLSTRLSELRDDGFIIHSKWKKVGRGRVMEYWM